LAAEYPWTDPEYRTLECAILHGIASNVHSANLLHRHSAFDATNGHRELARRRADAPRERLNKASILDVNELSLESIQRDETRVWSAGFARGRCHQQGDCERKGDTA
jgi:hypothetical protein